jgi:acyl-CoA thioesterase I
LPPISWWLWVGFAIALLSGLAIFRNQRHAAFNSASAAAPRRDIVHRAVLVACVLVALVQELPYRFFTPPPFKQSQFLIVGDSVTAGLNDGEDTWPQRLSRATPLQIVDASQPGATLRSAWKQVDLVHQSSGLLLLEVGSNDLLEGLAVTQFEHDLDQLFARACEPGRTVWMFELPLPPLACRYGAVQRRLAHQYGVALIPRQSFLQVLTASGATVDGIHLSATGHQLMAGLLQKLLKVDARLGGTGGSYRHIE